jgi:hypothetical protein
MGICAKELREYVIRPTLKQIGQYSRAAENLLLGTAAQESGLGSHLKPEHSHGLGIYQISRQRHMKVWDQYLVNLPELASDIRGLASQHEFLEHPHAELTTNLSYATAIAWAVYCQSGVVLPQNADNAEALAQQWLQHFHRTGGSRREFVKTWRELSPGIGKSLAA